MLSLEESEGNLKNLNAIDFYREYSLQRKRKTYSCIIKEYNLLQTVVEAGENFALKKSDLHYRWLVRAESKGCFLSFFISKVSFSWQIRLNIWFQTEGLEKCG